MLRKSTFSMAFAIASMIFFSACTKSETGNGGNDGLEFHHITLSAGSVSDKDESAESTASKSSNGGVDDKIATKAIFAENVKSNTDFYWQKNDKIGVLASSSENLYPLTLESRSTNLKTATFGGDIKGTLRGYAVYPYNENHKISGNTLTYHLPSEYDLSYMDVDYLDSSDHVDSCRTSANPALLAKITSEDGSGATCEFKQLGGVLCIKMADATNSSNIEVIIIADRQISGDFNVDLNSSEPVIKTTSDATADPDVMGVNNYIKIKGLVYNYNKGCVFYIPMPVGEYNLRILFGVSNSPNYGNWYNASPVKTLEINRCNIKRASLNYSTLYKNGGYMLVNGIKYIDLGLPSGKLWATTNVGATLRADYGNYYTLSEMTSALGSKKCHIPSDTEFQELIDNTDKEYTSGEKNSSGEWTAGAYLKKKTDNDCLIFFPFSGLYRDSDYAQDGTESCSWSSTKMSEKGYDYQKFLSISLSNGKVDAQVIRAFTTYKLTIRPVITP